ncbi:MAG: hypothetical protein COA82_03490 [Alkaliphilus sp.]|nr:MAG: hypothetical protein COA82_03490 [Alkaliphilus sp.]
MNFHWYFDHQGELVQGKNITTYQRENHIYHPAPYQVEVETWLRIEQKMTVVTTPDGNLFKWVVYDDRGVWTMSSIENHKRNSDYKSKFLHFCDAKEAGLKWALSRLKIIKQ